MDAYFVIAILGQMLGGVVMAVGVIVGLRLALPSFARALARELDAARNEPVDAAEQPSAHGRSVVILESRDELRNGG